MTIEHKKPESLKGASYNPKSRTEKSRLTELLKSIKKIGIQYPVLVSQDGAIIDGHRRTTCAVMLGIETIPVMVATGDPDVIYGEVNGATRPLTSAERLSVYVSCPEAVTTRARSQFDVMARVMGKDGMREMVRRQLSIQTFRQAKQIAAYCEDTSDKFVKSACLWIARQKMSYLVRKAIEEEVSPQILSACVKDDKPLGYKWGAA